MDISYVHFMLSHLANLVASGTRSSSGFKQVHLRECARALNEKFMTDLTSDQISNHLKNGGKRFQKINELREVSGAIWDEDNFIISLADKHYNDHVQDHKGNAEFFNKPLVNYGEMLTIFGSTMATGKYARDSSSVLGTDDVATEIHDVDDGPPTMDHDERSSASKPKKAKTSGHDDEGLIGAFERVGDKLAAAIPKAGTPDNHIPVDLFQNLNSILGFVRIHISHYYAYLVANPHIARAFNDLPFENKLDLVAMYVSEKFPNSM
uniref:Myb/SANT-like domain-containing protein n=1 Tax=Leersia perrieri TaxID=77586 RepID=A0A0D9V228_9ORYZ